MTELTISARNAIKGTIRKITDGAVNSEVVVEIADGIEIVSIITRESAEQLALETGKTVYAVVKASDVMIGV